MPRAAVSRSCRARTRSKSACNRHALAAQDAAPALEPRQIEQVADDALEPMRFIVDDAQVALARRRVELAAPCIVSVST